MLKYFFTLFSPKKLVKNCRVGRAQSAGRAIESHVSMRSAHTTPKKIVKNCRVGRAQVADTRKSCFNALCPPYMLYAIFLFFVQFLKNKNNFGIADFSVSVNITEAGRYDLHSRRNLQRQNRIFQIHFRIAVEITGNR